MTKQPGDFWPLSAVVLAGHAMIALVWWWLMPGGFPVAHLRFWINGVLPWLIVVLAVVPFFPGRLPRETLRIATMTAFAFLWIAAAISARLTFPITFRFLWIGPLLAGIAIGTVGIAESRRGRRSRWSAVTIAVVMASACGAVVPIAQRTSFPDTRPTNTDLRVRKLGAVPELVTATASLSDSVQVLAKEGIVIQKSRQRMISIEPMLTFRSRSPDRCWTLFAKGRARRGPERQINGLEQLGAQIVISYRDDGFTTLDVDASATSHVTRIESISHLPMPVWSHLNSFAQLIVTARGTPSVSFSPCPRCLKSK